MTTQRRRVGRPRKTESADTRAKMLDTALDLFVEHGYSATSVRMIARACELSDSGLYAHFARKRAIYDALLHAAGPGQVEQVLRDKDLPHSVPKDPAGFLTELVHDIVERFSTTRARKFARLLLREEIPVRPEMVTGLIETGAAAVAPLFEAWAERGRLAPQVRQALESGELTGEQLGWELLAPLGFLRMAYLHGPAGTYDIGRDRAEQHLTFFLSTVLGD